jgi:hypothetical protein
MTGCLFCIVCVLFEVWLRLDSLVLLVMAAADALLGMVNIDLCLFIFCMSLHGDLLLTLQPPHLQTEKMKFTCHVFLPVLLWRT